MSWCSVLAFLTPPSSYDLLKVKYSEFSCSFRAPWVPASVYEGLDENNNITLSLYPNPAVSETFVTIENAGLNIVSVYDVQGRLVSTTSVDATAGEQVRISTESLNAGMYFITVSGDNVVRSAKFVVK